ncbi:unnamed protein product [Symbiodinium natans]|uniref:Uncharacterized protein n=1 Tax=Symbiodinium natans TaxID=878477 RepID=A0A812N1G0_9DINO|nr:unnamed protein product [Symbiodinium natans]
MAHTAAGKEVHAHSDVAPQSFTPWQYVWKSRVPLIAVPVLAGLRQLPPRPVAEDTLSSILLEVALLCGLAVGSGYVRLPFSATWWLVLLAALITQTRFILGVATVLSLSVLLTWYGLRLQHAAAVTALWGGGVLTSPWSRLFWQSWDLCVHGLPALAMLWFHGPCLGLSGPMGPGPVTASAAAAALPLSLLWLFGLCLGLPEFKCNLCQTRLAYRIAPGLPKEAWRWVHGSHGFVCLAWFLSLALPSPAAGIYGLFAFIGLIRQPFTLGWWCLFLTSLWFTFGQEMSRTGSSLPEPALQLLQGMTCCCAATTATGFYGVQVLAPHAFASLIDTWIVDPMVHACPSHSALIRRIAATRSFRAATRLGDCFLHLFPTTGAILLFWPSVTAAAAFLSLPANLIWLLSTGSWSLDATNRLYGVKPPLKAATLHFVYGSHWTLCLGLGALCLAAGKW